MGDCMSKERTDQGETTERSTSPVVTQPSRSGVDGMDAPVNQSGKGKKKAKKSKKYEYNTAENTESNQSDTNKDKKNNKSKTVEQSKKQNGVDKPQQSMDMTQAGNKQVTGATAVTTSGTSGISNSSVPAETSKRPTVHASSSNTSEQHSMDMTQAGNKQVTGATAVTTSGASGISNSSVPADTSKRPTVHASSSNTSEKVVHDKDRSKSEISVHSTVSMENVQVLVAETQDALTKQDVLQKKERDVQAELDKAIMNVQASKGKIQKLKDELEDAENKRKAAEKDAEDKTKQLEDARKELEKEKQQNERKYKEKIKEKEELKKAKQDADNEIQKQQQEKDKLTNELENLKKKYEKRKKKDDHNKLAEEITSKNAQLQQLQTKVKEHERIADILKIKESELKQLKKEKEELYLRLSAMAGRKLTDNNPNIADLSDSNRPTKLGETYSQIYDNEWTDAFSYLETLDDYQNSEQKCIDVLFQTISIAYRLTLNKANSELETLKHAVNDIGGGDHSGNIKDFLKQMKDSRKKRVLPEDDLKQEYKSKIQEKFPKIPCDTDSTRDLDKYRSSCLNTCWLMAIQDPPVHLECGDQSCKPGDRLDKGRYKEYTQSGQFIEFPVWPAMYLHEGGSVLSKGVVQCTKTKTFSTTLHVSSTSGSRIPDTQNMSKSLNEKDLHLSTSRSAENSLVTQL